jgi:glucokinase
VGAGIPGPLDLETGRTVFLANLPGWEDVPIVEPLARALGRPVGLINDARAFTLAELELGAGRGCRNLVGITLGTGIGGGIVVDGELLLHLSGTVGEVGHLTLVPDGVPAQREPRLPRALRGGPAIARSAGMETAEAVMRPPRGDQRRSTLAQAGTALGIRIANVITVARSAWWWAAQVAGRRPDLEPARRSCAANMKPVERVDIVPAGSGPGQRDRRCGLGATAAGR